MMKPGFIGQGDEQPPGDAHLTGKLGIWNQWKIDYKDINI